MVQPIVIFISKRHFQVEHDFLWEQQPLQKFFCDSRVDNKTKHNITLQNKKTTIKNIFQREKLFFICFYSSTITNWMEFVAFFYLTLFNLIVLHHLRNHSLALLYILTKIIDLNPKSPLDTFLTELL